MLREDSAQTHIAELDGLRALAVVPVIAYHFGANVNGSAGVTVFFALSGFIVTTVLLREHDQAGTIRLGGFYLRRFRRLLPASTLVVAATVITGWILSKPPIERQAFAALTYWANIERQTSSYSYGQANFAPLEHFWSLAIEEQFYLFLPLLCVLLLRFGRKHLGAVVTVGLLASVWFAHAGRSDPQMYFHSAARVCELLVGVLLALAARRVHMVWGYVALAALIVVLSGVVRPSPIITAAITCVVIAGLPRMLAASPLEVIGRYSYGLYLWHPLSAMLATNWPTRVVLTSALTLLSYHLVEFPVRFRLSRPTAIGTMAAMSIAGIAVVMVPLGELKPTFIPSAPAVAAASAEAPAPSGTVATAEAPDSTGPVATQLPSPVEATPRPLRVSGAGDSTQMFMNGAWEAHAVVNPDAITWVGPPDDLAIWTSGADDWIRTEAPKARLSLPHDGPQGGIDRQGCPLIYEQRIRPIPIWPFFDTSDMHSATPIATCDWHLWIPQALSRMDLDVLVVSWGVTAMWEYEMPDGSTSYVGQPDFDALLATRMAEFEAMAASYGTTVVWLTYSPEPDENGERWTLPSTADSLAAVMLQRPCTYDLRLFVRSEPTYDWYQDGYHFTAEGAARAVAPIAESMRSCTLVGVSGG